MGQTTSTSHPTYSSSSASCPVDHSAFAKHPQSSSDVPSSCPVDHASPKNRVQSSTSAAGCPVDHASLSKSSSSRPAECPVQTETLDPRNHLPTLTQERAASQTIDLPTERTASSIPRDTTGNWEYPSPQQFYN